MTHIIESGMLLFALLNPFLLVVYLFDPMNRLDSAQFQKVLLRAGLIASMVFCCFAVLGDALFSQVLHTEFASFQIFGGLIFVLIGIQFVFKGPTTIELLRGEAAHISGAIAMPILIGPGTISASVVIGKRLDALLACMTVVITTYLALMIVIVLKILHDYVRPRHESLIKRYIEVTGRITALYIGTVAIEMIMVGTRTWIEKF
jgi:small neutral amino acid transporter SnatA (MarC family)